MKIYLIGLPGSGKSSFGKRLAGVAKLPFIDLDTVIEQETSLTVSKIFSEKGEEYFRNLEAVALRQQSKNQEFVIACGGGTPCFHNNMKFILESGKSIFMNPSVDEIATRLEREKESRPLLADTDHQSLKKKLTELLEKRISFYNQANITLTESASPEDVLLRIKN